MVTNQGRVTIFGPRYRGGRPWELFYTSDGMPSRIFFEKSPHGIRRLAFESPKPISQSQSIRIPIPSYPYPEHYDCVDCGYFYSSAAMENVIKIIPCEEEYVVDHRTIVGLLFRYSDGTQACVGRFRLDCAGTPLVVGKSPQMWLSFYEDMRIIVDMGVSSPPWPMSPTCLYVSWAGKLEWWFSQRQCRLHYGDQSSIELFFY